MKFIGRVKARSHFNTTSNLLEYIELPNVMSIGDTMQITFNNERTNFIDKIERFKITKRILAQNTDIGLCDIGNDKPHLVYEIESADVEPLYSNESLFIFGFICLCDPKKKESWDAKNTYKVKRFPETSEENFTLAAQPVVTDLVEFKGGYFSIENINYDTDKKYTIVELGEIETKIDLILK